MSAGDYATELALALVVLLAFGLYRSRAARVRDVARLDQRLATTLESITDAFFTVDRGWCFSYLNAHAARLLQLRPDDTNGVPLWRRLPAWCGSEFERQFREAVNTRQARSFEALHAPTGAWFEVQAYPSEEGLTVYFRDVSERRRVAEALRVSEAKLRSIVDNEPECVKVVAADGRLLDMNRAGLRMIDADDIDSVRGRALIDLVHPDDRAAFGELHRRASAGTPGQLRFRIIGLKGSERWMETHSAPLPLADGVSGTVLSVARDITERTLAEQKLREQAELLSNAQRIGRIGSWSMDLRSGLLTWSDAAGELFGLAPDAFDGSLKQFRELVLPEDRAVLDAAYARAEATDGLIEIEYRIARPDGDIRWMYERGNIEYDDGGRALRRRGMLLDITERKRTQLQLSRANRALRLLTACNDALFRADDEKLLLAEICDAVVKVGGYSMAWIGYASEADGRAIVPVAQAGRSTSFLTQYPFNWDEQSAAGQAIPGRVIRCGVPVVVRDLAADPATPASDRGALDFGLHALVCLPLHDRDRTFGLLAMYGSNPLPAISNELPILQDLADNLAYGISALRVRSEQQRLQLALQKMAAAVSADSGTAIFDHLVREMTEAVGARAGLMIALDEQTPTTATVLAGVADGAVLSGGQFDIADTPCAALLAHVSHVAHAGSAGLFAGSAGFPVHGARSFVGRRLDDNGGRAVGQLLLLFNDDVQPEGLVASALQIFAARAAAELERRHKDQARKQLMRDLQTNEERLRRALDDLDRRNHELQEFAFVASHDLQEPLRKIRAFSDRLLQRNAAQLDDQGRDFLDRSMKAVTRMQSLIDDLLAFSRVSARGQAFAPVDLQAVAATVLEDLDARIETTMAQIDVGPLPRLHGDATQLRQVLQNLVSNALKYVAPGRRPILSITSTALQTPDGPAFCIRVQDNGIGFDPRHADRIFAPFQRLHSRQQYDGTGIGLAIVKRIVERHRGVVRADARPGEGATIEIVLPEHHPDGPAGPASTLSLDDPSAPPSLEPTHAVAYPSTRHDPDGGR